MDSAQASPGTTFTPNVFRSTSKAEGSTRGLLGLSSSAGEEAPVFRRQSRRRSSVALLSGSPEANPTVWSRGAVPDYVDLVVLSDDEFANIPASPPKDAAAPGTDQAQQPLGKGPGGMKPSDGLGAPPTTVAQRGPRNGPVPPSSSSRKRAAGGRAVHQSSGTPRTNQRTGRSGSPARRGGGGGVGRKGGCPSGSDEHEVAWDRVVVPRVIADQIAMLRVTSGVPTSSPLGQTVSTTMVDGASRAPFLGTLSSSFDADFAIHTAPARLGSGNGSGDVLSTPAARAMPKVLPTVSMTSRLPNLLLRSPAASPPRPGARAPMPLSLERDSLASRQANAMAWYRTEVAMLRDSEAPHPHTSR